MSIRAPELVPGRWSVNSTEAFWRERALSGGGRRAQDQGEREQERQGT